MTDATQDARRPPAPGEQALTETGRGEPTPGGEVLAASYAETWESGRRGGRSRRSVADGTRASYYNLPVIHKPHWKWEIWLYFFLGGIAGGSYVVAAIARLLGGNEGRRIARVGTYVSLATVIPSPILLIMDLKRPSRFYNMLRIVKLRSPMSVGTWGLVLFSGFSALSALNQAADDGLLGRSLAARLLAALPARVIGVLGSGPAFFVGGYTGVLLAATAVPLWTKRHLLMGPLFLTSAVSNATAAIALSLALGGRAPAAVLKRLERLDVVALLAELALIVIFKRAVGPTIGRPLDEGRLGKLHTYGVLGAGLLAPLAIQGKSVLSGTPPSRPVVTLASVLVLIGGMLFRYVMVTAGKLSADDPHATFELTG